jgi:hypothetical protein
MVDEPTGPELNEPVLNVVSQEIENTMSDLQETFSASPDELEEGLKRYMHLNYDATFPNWAPPDQEAPDNIAVESNDADSSPGQDGNNDV